MNGYGYTKTTVPFKFVKEFQKLELYARENKIDMWKISEKLKVYNLKIAMIHHEGRDEYFIITNFGNRSVNLKGWKLYSHGGQEYIFPAIELFPGASVSIHSGPGATGIVWTRKYVWNDEGDKAILYDPEGNVVDVYEY